LVLSKNQQEINEIITELKKELELEK